MAGSDCKYIQTALNSSLVIWPKYIHRMSPFN
jgi:hypothetical protein